MIEANGLDPERHSHVREQMVQLISMVEGFFACGVAASTYATTHPSGTAIPDTVFANIGKLLLANQIPARRWIPGSDEAGDLAQLPNPRENRAGREPPRPRHRRRPTGHQPPTRKVLCHRVPTSGGND